MTAGFVFDESIMWVDILLLVKKPISVSCAPLRGIEYRKCIFPFTGPSGKGIPLRSSLDHPLLFTAESFCLIQKLTDGDLGRPNRCIFLDKRDQ